MDPNTIFDQGSAGDHPPVEAAREWPGVKKNTEPNEVRFPAEDGGKSLAEMALRDLDATLQLLAERAQYITQATGAAIALRDGDEMVCKASAGTSAPEVGARLQMESGLSGESIRTKQVLRCDDAQTDGRVNRESCEALGIASVLVMPMIDDEEVLGVFELFSDHAHAFEERDIAALERMAFMVRTAIARAETGSDENAVAAAEDIADVAAGAHDVDVAAKEVIPEKVEGEEATPGPSAKPTEEAVRAAQEPVVQEPVTKDEISLEMPVKKGAEISAFTEPEDEVAPTAHTSKIAFHIRGPLPRKAAEPTVAAGSSAVGLESANAEASATKSARPSTPAGIPNEASKTSDLKVEASAGSSGAAVAPALAAAEKAVAAEEVSAEPTSGTVGPIPNSPPKPADAAPVTLTFGAALVPDAAKKPTEEAKTPPAPPAGHTAKPTEEIPASKTPVATEAEKTTAAPAVRSVERARSAVAGLRRCESCGFPVSEARKLCLDCEKKKGAGAQTPVKAEAKGENREAAMLDSPAKATPVAAPAEKSASSSFESTKPEGDGPQFLVASPDGYESWIVRHMYAAVAGAVVLIGVIVYLLSR